MQTFHPSFRTRFINFIHHIPILNFLLLFEILKTDSAYSFWDKTSENTAHSFSANESICFRSYCERVFRDCRLQTCYVQSPAYPGVYPRNLHCRYYLNTRLPFIKLYIENEEFNIDGQRCENIMTCPMRPISSGW